MAAWDHDFLVDFYPVVHRGAATLEGSTELRARGRAMRRGTATMSGGTELLAHGREMRRAAAIVSGGTELLAHGRAMRHASATMTGGTELRATGRLQRVTLYHVIMTGQSNSIGYNTVPYNGLAASDVVMFNGGLYPGNTAINLASLVPLQEPYSGVLTTPYWGQSPCTTMANQLKALLGATPCRMLVSSVGVSGYPYTSLKKGTQPYTDSLAQVTKAKALAAANGWDYAFLALAVVHGEADDITSLGPSYPAALVQWQSDYDTDIKAITGQSGTIPMIHSAQQAYPAERQWGGSTLGSSTQISLLTTSIANPDKIVVACPQVMMWRVADPHYDRWSYMWMGEFLGKAIYQHCIQGTRFSPLYPTAAVRTGAQIVVTYNVPVGSIVGNFDFTAFRYDWGFHYWDDSSSAYVSAVTVTAANQLTLTLSATPTGANKHLSYITRNVNYRMPGSAGVMDSDATVGATTGLPLRNFGVAFDLPLT